MDLMKLSNKILLAFFGFIFIYLTAAFAELRLTGTSNVINDKNSIAESEDIAGFAYLALKNLDKNITVTVSDRPRLEVRSFTGDLMKMLKYQMSGDTLKLFDLELEEARTVRITVFVPATGLKGISVDNSVVIIEGLDQDGLNITQNAGRVFLSESKIGTMQVDAASHSYFHISSTELDTLTARLQESELLLSSPVSVLKGSMEESSFLHLSNVAEIQFRKDESSRLNLYQ
jgi:hypothetical protein